MEKINRRNALAAIPACGLAAIVPAAAEAVTVRDPIIDAINAYRTGMAAYNGREDFANREEEDAAIAETWGPPMAVLGAWDKPAVSRQGALEALRFAIEEAEEYSCSEMLTNAARAALRYFEQEAV